MRHIVRLSCLNAYSGDSALKAHFEVAGIFSILFHNTLYYAHFMVAVFVHFAKTIYVCIDLMQTCVSGSKYGLMLAVPGESVNDRRWPYSVSAFLFTQLRVPCSPCVNEMLLRKKNL